MIGLGKPAHGLCFIRHVETAERYAKSDIVIPIQARDKVARQQFEVVAVGPDEECEDDDCDRPHWYDWEDPTETRTHRCDVRPGDWVLCRNRSWDATPDPSIYIVKVKDIIGKFAEGV